MSRSSNLSDGLRSDKVASQKLKSSGSPRVNQDDDITALQVRNLSGEWISAPPIPGAFVCNEVIFQWFVRVNSASSYQQFSKISGLRSLLLRDKLRCSSGASGYLCREDWRNCKVW
ncbi:hypothetical protein Q3G72_008327 [Acer saccharum]|nr:hypothetical protein Q3G72_008327 [Acer saccharum]